MFEKSLDLQQVTYDWTPSNIIALGLSKGGDKAKPINYRLVYRISTMHNYGAYPIRTHHGTHRIKQNSIGLSTWILAKTTMRNSKHHNSWRVNICPCKTKSTQGTVLGPLMFLLYTNDIGTGIKTSIRLFCVWQPNVCSYTNSKPLSATTEKPNNTSKLEWEIAADIQSLEMLCLKSNNKKTTNNISIPNEGTYTRLSRP